VQNDEIIQDENDYVKKLYLTEPDLTSYTDFISCDEVGTTAKIFSDSFLDDVGLEYFNSITSYSFNGMLIRTKNNIWSNNSERSISISYLNSDAHRFGFNGTLYVGDSLNDVISLYGEPIYLDNIRIRYYNVPHITELGILLEGDIVDAIRIEPEIIPILSCEEYLSIYSLTTSTPNSADGVDVEITFTNDSEKTIKYIYFSTIPYNAVNDVVNSDIGDKSTAILSLTGPVEPSEDFKTVSAENIWYNSTIRYAKLETVNIIYMDGEEVTLHVQ